MIDLKQLDITGNKYFAIGDIENLLNKYSRIPLILECSLKMLMFNRLIFPLLDKYNNLYIETSNLLLVNQIEDIVDKFGSKRLIFGTNYPFLDIEFSIGRLLLSDLDESSKDDISFGNINNILNNIEVN
jgi:predicted TIM-barrel fold metal-dependent hydrolase